MTVRLDEWESLIATEVNGAPVPTMLDAVRDAAIEFCQKTLIDTRLLESIDYDPDTPELCVTADENAVVPVRVITVWSTQARLEPRTKRELELLYPAGWPRQTVGSVRDLRYWTSPRPDVVRLVPRLTIEAPDEFTFDVAFAPRRDAREVADFLFHSFAEDIAAGAVARLHAHSDAPYAQPERAAAYRQAFVERMARVADRGIAGHQKPRHRTGNDEIS